MMFHVVFYVCFLFCSVTTDVQGGADTTDACSFCDLESCEPSVKGADESSFNPTTDAATLSGAMGYLYVDKQMIINVLTDRTEKQRLAIVSKYKELYKGHKFKEDISDITYRDIKTLFEDLVTPLSGFYAKYLNKAVIEKNLIRITEIFTTLSQCAIQEVHNQYKNMYHVNLNDAISESLSRKYPNKNIVELILLLGEGKRQTPSYKRRTKEWNKKADDDAKDLVKVFVQDKWDDKTKKIREILGQRTLPEIQDFIVNYEKRYYDDKKTKLRKLEDDIKKAKFETAEGIYMTIVNIARNQPQYFAVRLKEVLKPKFMWSVDRNELNYIIVGRSGIDLEDIKKAFREKYGTSLYETILTKIIRTNNDYYNAILRLIKEES